LHLHRLGDPTTSSHVATPSEHDVVVHAMSVQAEVDVEKCDPGAQAQHCEGPVPSSSTQGSVDIVHTKSPWQGVASAVEHASPNHGAKVSTQAEVVSEKTKFAGHSHTPVAAPHTKPEPHGSVVEHASPYARLHLLVASHVRPEAQAVSKSQNFPVVCVESAIPQSTPVHAAVHSQAKSLPVSQHAPSLRHGEAYVSLRVLSGWANFRSSRSSCGILGVAFSRKKRQSSTSSQPG